VHTEVLPWTICLPTLVVIAQAVFLLEHGQTDKQTDRQTDAAECPTHAVGYTAGVDNDMMTSTPENRRNAFGASPPRWPAVTLTFDLQNVVGAVGYCL